MSSNIWERMLNIDRRWIYLSIGIVAIVPFFVKFGMPVVTTEEVENIFNYVDQLGSEDAIFVSFDFAPGTSAENMPMAVAVIRHALHNHIPFFMTASYPIFQTMMISAMEYVLNPETEGFYQNVPFEDWQDLRDSGITKRDELVAAWEAEGHQLPEGALGWAFEGRDYAMLGYAPVFNLVILGMTTSIETQYPTDIHGNATSEMPMLQEHKNLREVDLALTCSGSSACTWWVTYAREKIGLPVAFGVTAVMATDYYPYIQTGQVVGQMGGLRGAAEYEVLLAENGITPTTDKAFTGMDVQSAAHLLIIFFIIMGNIAYFAGGFHKKRLLKGGR